MRVLDDEYRWIGPKELQQRRARWKFTIEKITCTVAFDGPYDTMVANVPPIGNTLKGITVGGSYLPIVDVDINEKEGPAGEMTVTLEIQRTTRQDDTFQVGDPTYELEFAELLKKIETHPNCGPLKPGTTKTWDDWATLSNDDYDTRNAARAHCAHSGALA